jgi:hypothetical protein
VNSVPPRTWRTFGLSGLRHFADADPGRASEIVAERIADLAGGMRATLHRMKAALEDGGIKRSLIAGYRKGARSRPVPARKPPAARAAPGTCQARPGSQAPAGASDIERLFGCILYASQPTRIGAPNAGDARTSQVQP